MALRVSRAALNEVKCVDDGWTTRSEASGLVTHLCVSPLHCCASPIGMPRHTNTPMSRDGHRSGARCVLEAMELERVGQEDVGTKRRLTHTLFGPLPFAQFREIFSVNPCVCLFFCVEQAVLLGCCCAAWRRRSTNIGAPTIYLQGDLFRPARPSHEPEPGTGLADRDGGDDAIACLW